MVDGSSRLVCRLHAEHDHRPFWVLLQSLAQGYEGDLFTV
jgi:hypothetical protein